MPRFRTVGVAILSAGLCFSSPLAGQQSADRLIAEGRRAIGIDGTTLVRLSVDLMIRRSLGSRTPSRVFEVQLRFVLPDKYLRIETVRIGDRFSRTSSIGVNGTELLFEDGGAAAEMRADPRMPGPDHDRAVTQFRRELFRLLTVWLLTPPADAQCTFSSAGTTDTKDATLNIVDVRGQDGRSLQLFLDASSHRVSSASYEQEIVDPEKAKALLESFAAKRPPGSAIPIEQTRLHSMTLREEMSKLPRKTVTAQMRFSRHRRFGSVTFPETMTVETDELKEEWKILSVKVNPPADPSFFGG